MSSGSVGGISKVSAAAAMSGARSRVPGTPWLPTMSTCSSFGSAARMPAIFLRYSASVVTRTRASPIAIRARIGSGPKAAKSVHRTAFAFHAPSAAK